MRSMVWAVTFFLCGSIYAADWKTIYKSPHDTASPQASLVAEVDVDSVVSKDGLVSAWLRYSETPAQDVPFSYPKTQYQSALMLYHFNCVDRTSAASQRRYFEGPMASGASVGSMNVSEAWLPKIMLPANPGTVGTLALDFVCAMGFH